MQTVGGFGRHSGRWMLEDAILETVADALERGKANGLKSYGATGTARSSHSL